MSYDQEQRRGNEAEQLLANPLLKEAFAVVEARIVSELKNMDITEEKRERLQLLLALGDKYQKYLRDVVTTGNMAGMEVERQRTLTERIRRFAT